MIPDRKDRPEFLKNCLRLIENQTLKPALVELVNDEPLNFDSHGQLVNDKKPDITWRYRVGYDRLRNKNIDAIAFLENDDWYAANYLETMANEWAKRGRPDLFGTSYTIYYNLIVKGYFTMNHPTRSSAMSTIIKPDLNFPWCNDNEPYTDLHLWTKSPSLKGIVFKPTQTICMGMKHGVGLCGGRSHTDRLHRYQACKDENFNYLASIVDKESLEFYKQIHKQLCNTK